MAKSVRELELIIMRLKSQLEAKDEQIKGMDQYATAATPPSFLKYMSYRLYRITRGLIIFCKPDADSKGFVCAMNKTPVKSS